MGRGGAFWEIQSIMVLAYMNGREEEWECGREGYTRQSGGVGVLCGQKKNWLRPFLWLSLVSENGWAHSLHSLCHTCQQPLSPLHSVVPQKPTFHSQNTLLSTLFSYTKFPQLCLKNPPHHKQTILCVWDQLNYINFIIFFSQLSNSHFPFNFSFTDWINEIIFYLNQPKL